MRIIQFLRYSAIVLLSIGLNFLFYSCEYEPKEVYNLQVNPDVQPPEIQEVALDLQSDTIYLIANKTLHFSFTSSNQAIQSVAWYIDDELKETVNSESGNFTLNHASFLTDHFYDLGIKVFTGSGSGSIAEHLGNEGFLFEKHWVLVVIDGYEKIVRNSIADGRLRLEWDPCPVDNLIKYLIIRQGQNYVPYIIGESNVPQFIDSSYIGEGANYIIMAQLASEQFIQWGTCQLAPDLPHMMSYCTPQNINSVYWTGRKYYNNIAGCTLYQDLNNTGSYTQIYSTESLADTMVAIGNVKFGDEMDFRLELAPHPYKTNFVYSYFNRPLVYASLVAGYQFAERIDDDEQIIEVENNQILYSSPGKGLVRFSLGTLKAIESYKYVTPEVSNTSFERMCGSPKGKCFTSAMFGEDLYFSGFSSNFASISNVDLDPIIGAWAISIPVSDNQIGLVNSLWGGPRLYNFNTHQVIDEYTIDPTITYGVAISSNADYLIIRDQGIHLFKYANHSFDQLYTLPGEEIKFVEFSKTEAEQFAFWDGSNFQIKRCTDFSDVVSFPLSDAKILSVDYSEQMMLTSGPGKLIVRSLVDGALILEIPVDPSNLYSSNYYLLSDNKIISNMGIIYFL
ncbi:MAG: hypothetical protein IPH88_05525 [Bacteroidales bacterium]|nr:hypothetical protein [Bacteroidales bacterium]